MVNFWTITCILATWAVVVVDSVHHHPSASSQPPAAAPGGPAAGPSVDCGSLIYKMTDCLQFLTVGGTDSKPEASCCSGFKEVVNIDAQCICAGFKSAADMGFTIDMKKAATLPSACGVSAPPLSSCNMSTTPGASPVNPPQLAPPPKSPKPPVPTLPPTASPPTPTAPSVPSGAPAPVTQAPAPAPSPLSSGADTIYSSFLVSLTMVVSAAVFIIFK